MFCGIGLVNSHNPFNVAVALRNAEAFGVDFIGYTGRRYDKVSADVSDAVNKIPMFRVEDIKSIIPYDCVPVAVELLDDASSIVDFVHPQKAFYIFGAEDATLGKSVTSMCKHKIYIPTSICLNLAVSIGIVMYDRHRQFARK